MKMKRTKTTNQKQPFWFEALLKTYKLGHRARKEFI